MNNQREKPTDILSQKMPCKDYMESKIGIVLNGTKEHGLDFTRKDMNRIKVYNADFDKCVFIGVACDASVFQNVSFVSCDFTGATFQDSNFTNCMFIDCHIESANFSRSTFINSKIINSTVVMSTMHQGYLEKCCIIGGNYHTATFNGTKIIDSEIQDIDLSHLNLEFIMILGVTLKGSVILPPYQVAYIINGMEFAVKYPNKYVIGTDNGEITGDDFISLLHDLQEFYEIRGEHFPVANILLCQRDVQKAIDVIKDGIQSSMNIKDFRMVKNYCWMLKETSLISIDEKHIIYREINSHINTIHLTQSEYYSYTTYISEIRELLMNSIPSQPRLEIVISTDFSQKDIEKVYELFDFITEVMSKTKSNSHVDFIEIRHNSPYEIILSCVDNVPELMYAVATIYFIISKVIPKLLDVSKQSLEIAKQAQELHYDKLFKKHEIASWEIEAEGKKLENEKIRLENLKLSKELRLSEPTIIGINGIRHTISASSISDIENIPTTALMGDYKK